MPGTDRIADFTVIVSRLQPVSPSPDQMVCYGVESRTQTETSPEYIISHDPMDPVFYSTCYVREKNITWRAALHFQNKIAPRWNFNGKCLACENYHANALPENVTKRTVPKWVLTDTCEDCLAGTSLPLASGVEYVCPSTLQTGSGGSGDNSSGGSTNVIIIVAIVALLTLTTAYILYRRHHNFPLNPLNQHRSSGVLSGAEGHIVAYHHNPVYKKPTRAAPSKSRRGSISTMKLVTNPSYERPSRAAPTKAPVTILTPTRPAPVYAVPEPLESDKIASIRVPMPTYAPKLVPRVTKKISFAQQEDEGTGKNAAGGGASMGDASWQAFVDDSIGVIYYVDNTTGVTQWESPLNRDEWVEAIDGSEVYFINLISGESQWEFPDIREAGC